MTALTAAAPAALDTGDTAWLLAASALVLLMAPGLALFYGGMVRSKSVLNMMMMTFGSLAVITLLWVLVGYSLAFGDDVGAGLLGSPTQYAGLGQLMSSDSNGGSTVPLILFAAFQGLFCVITGALVSGAIADRARFGAWLVFVSVWTLLVYAPVAHWVFDRSADGHTGGWLLNRVGLVDFAGGTAVEICSGASALALALVLGHRVGFGKDPMRPHNLTLVMLGAGLLGSAGSASTPAPRSAPTRRRRSSSPRPWSPAPPGRSAGWSSSGCATGTPRPWVRRPAWSPGWSRSPRPAARSRRSARW